MAEPMIAPGISTAEYAARLRLIKNIGGTLFHERAFEVYESDDKYWQVYDVWHKLVAETCSNKDARAFAKAGAARTVVVDDPVKGLVFSFTEDADQTAQKETP